MKKDCEPSHRPFLYWLIAGGTGNIFDVFGETKYGAKIQFTDFHFFFFNVATRKVRITLQQIHIHLANKLPRGRRSGLDSPH